MIFDYSQFKSVVLTRPTVHAMVLMDNTFIVELMCILHYIAYKFTDLQKFWAFRSHSFCTSRMRSYIIFPSQELSQPLIILWCCTYSYICILGISHAEQLLVKTLQIEDSYFSKPASVVSYIQMTFISFSSAHLEETHSCISTQADKVETCPQAGKIALRIAHSTSISTINSSCVRTLSKHWSGIDGGKPDLKTRHRHTQWYGHEWKNKSRHVSKCKHNFELATCMHSSGKQAFYHWIVSIHFLLVVEE